MSLENFCSNPACNRRYLLPDVSAGRPVRCLECGETFIAGASTTVEGAPVTHPPETTDPAFALTISASLGRFIVRGRLGAGTFGTVYRAYDPHLDREVALKVPNPGVMADAKQAERFLREAKSAARLRHPHIVPVFDAGQDGDCYYIASAFIDGKPLSEAIPETGIDFNRAARLVRELAEALAYAHEQGIVHRDVKPANIMLDKQDRVHLMDFGLAARHDMEAKLTAVGAVMGTACYMAPEQAAGHKGEAHGVVDQYAAGVVLYELLTGSVPFTGPLAAVLHNTVHTEPPPPRTHRHNVPKDLETICLKAMAKNPAHRYPNCRELADDLRRWLEGEAITARRMNYAERLARWVRKEPKLALAGAVIAVLVCVGAGLAFVSAESARQSAREQDELRRSADEAAAQAEREAASARAAEERAETALASALAAETKAVGEAERAKAAQTAAEGAEIQAKIEQAKANTALGEARTGRAAAEAAKTAAEAARDAEIKAVKKLEEAQRTLAVLAYPNQIRTASQLLEFKSYKEAGIVLDQCAADLRKGEWHYLNFLRARGDKPGFPHVAHMIQRNPNDDYAAAAISADGRRFVLMADKPRFTLVGDVLPRRTDEKGPSEVWAQGQFGTAAVDPQRPVSVTGGTVGREEVRIGHDLFTAKVTTRKTTAGMITGYYLAEVATAPRAATFCTPEGYHLGLVPGEALRFFWNKGDPLPQESSRLPTTAKTVALSGNGRLVATSEGTVYEVNWPKVMTELPQKADGNYVALFRDRYAAATPLVSTLAVANDGRIAFAEKGTAGLYIYTPGKVPQIKDVVGKWGNVTRIRFSPDGSRMAFIEGAYGPIYLVDTASGCQLLALRPSGSVLDIGFHAETGCVMAVTSGGRLNIWYTFDPALRP